jgi:hypothetical protein
MIQTKTACVPRAGDNHRNCACGEKNRAFTVDDEKKATSVAQHIHSLFSAHKLPAAKKIVF